MTSRSCLNSELHFFKYMQMMDQSEMQAAEMQHSNSTEDVTNAIAQNLTIDLDHGGGSEMANSRSGVANGAAGGAAASTSRYEAQKRRDWNTFGQFLRNHRPPLALGRCNGAHVLDFLRYLDQFGKTKVHATGCPFFGLANPPSQCPCPLRQAWGSLDALIGRLRAAFEEHGGAPEANPFAARIVRQHLREVREQQAKARGINYEKKKRKRASAAPSAPSPVDASDDPASSSSHEQIIA